MQPAFLRVPTGAEADVGSQCEHQKQAHETGGNRQDVLPVGFPDQVHKEQHHQQRFDTRDREHQGVTEKSALHERADDERRSRQYEQRHKHHQVFTHTPMIFVPIV